MRIVISGSAGIGKTTLSQYISSNLNYPLIPDFLDVILNERGYRRFREVNYEEGRQIRIEALERKIKAEFENPNFVSDKGVADYLAYWLISGMLNATNKENDRFFEATKDHIKIYDLVVIPPFGRFKIKANDIRMPSEHVQLRNHITIKGIYAELNIPFIEYSLDLNKSQQSIMEDLGFKNS